ncbi:MAG: enoyl-CoA hydratase/isomerase family protein [Planctomycetes bacterium]|nr:enoyl-CoA hydratase/isomerase family protein [Planctomycetota bacterium]
MNDNAVLLVESLNESTVSITLNRPDRRNALNIELMRALCAELNSLAADPVRRVVLLRGAGSVFCSGMDLQETSDPEASERSVDMVAKTFATLLDTNLITIAVAQGAAFAGGAGLLTCCDFAVASPDLRIGFPEVRRGLIPALVAAVTVNRLTDAAQRELFLVAEPILTERALALGLIHQIAPADELLQCACLLAGSILMGAPEAIRQCKSWLRDLRKIERSHLLRNALAFHKQAKNADEVREGLTAFQERREPDWTNCRSAGEL